MNDLTTILNAIEQGDPHAAGQLLPLVYDELRRLAAQKLAQEKAGQTLQATALVCRSATKDITGVGPSEQPRTRLLRNDVPPSSGARLASSLETI